MLLLSNNEQRKSFFTSFVLGLISYVMHIVGLISLTVALTMKNTFEYEIASGGNASKFADFLKKFGAYVDFSSSLSRVNSCEAVGIISLVIAFSFLIATIVSVFVVTKKNERATNRETSKRIYSEVKEVVRAQNRINSNLNGSSLYSENVYSQPHAVKTRYVNNYTSQRGGGLICLTGCYEGIRFPISEYDETIIGTDPNLCHVILEGGYTGISRLHLSVGYNAENNIYVVTDYSRDGTYVHGRRLPQNVPTSFSPGTIISLADGKNSFRLE